MFKESSSPPIPALTGLRFIAAFMVALGHGLHKFAPVPGEVPIWHSVFGSLPGLAMELFFVLSGFVIHYNYSSPILEQGGRGVYNFFVARFARLYPLYFLGLAFDLFNSYSYYQLTPHAGAALPYYLAMVQSWLYKPFGDRSLILLFGPLPSVAWSISVEWFFYLMYPLLCFLISRIRSKSKLALCTAVYIVAALSLVAVVIANRAPIMAAAATRYGPVSVDVQNSYFRWLLYFSPYSRIQGFILGCLTAELFLKQRETSPGDREQRIGRWLLLGSIAGTAVIFMMMFGLPSEFRPEWQRFFVLFHMCFGFAPFLALLTFCCARYQSFVVRGLSGRWILLCGEASYSLYLLHLVVMERVGMSSPPAVTTRILLGDLMRLGLCLLTCVGLSLVTWRLIEMPGRTWLRRLLSVPASSTDKTKLSVAGDKAVV